MHRSRQKSYSDILLKRNLCNSNNRVHDVIRGDAENLLYVSEQLNVVTVSIT